MSDVHVVLDRTRPCRGCGQEIAFIKTAMGKTMPVEPAIASMGKGARAQRAPSTPASVGISDSSSRK